MRPYFLLLVSLLLCFLLLSFSPAYSHKPSDSYITLKKQNGVIHAQWDIALRDLDYAIGLDDNNDGSITWGELHSHHKKIADYAIIANKEMWNFDIWGYHDSLQYTRYYGNGGHYDWHADLGPGLSNRKLSVVLQLSDPSEYEGGDLEINPGGNIMTVPKEMGLICFFPSFLLHRVTPLTSGNRITLVTWLCGANLR